jgi:hypothetical protein
VQGQRLDRALERLAEHVGERYADEIEFSQRRQRGDRVDAGVVISTLEALGWADG